MTMLLLLVVVIMIGFPTAFTLMALGIIFGFLGLQFRVFDLAVNKAFQLMTNDVLIAIPLFLFMGYIIERSGLLDSLFKSIQLATGPLRGSLAIATLITGTIFATATGIVGASVTLLGVLALPAMLRARYQTEFSTGVIAASGTLGILIPPSVLLILYGYVAGVSVPRLYAAAMLPGLMLAGLYFVYVFGRAYVQKDVAPALPKEERDHPIGTVLLMLLKGLVPITVLIGFVLLSILFGVATPTEAAALGALGGLVLAALYRRLSFANLKESVFLTMRTSAMVGWLLIGSSLFSGVFALLGGSRLLGDFVNGFGLNAVGFFWLMMVIVFFLGWPLEWTEITIIFLPLFLPLATAFGIDLVYLGVMLAINQQTSFLSPPVAMSAYYLMGVAPKGVRLNQIFKGMYPFMAIQLAALAIVWFVPDIANWLPRTLFDQPR
ncbi:MAG: TRAP transporter large permease subunit [Chloroflexota bacterium]|nr:TRAP transporter large permease subunit [Chloroflexota bacterium]